MSSSFFYLFFVLSTTITDSQPIFTHSFNRSLFCHLSSRWSYRQDLWSVYPTFLPQAAGIVSTYRTAVYCVRCPRPKLYLARLTCSPSRIFTCSLRHVPTRAVPYDGHHSRCMGPRSLWLGTTNTSSLWWMDILSRTNHFWNQYVLLVFPIVLPPS